MGILLQVELVVARARARLDAVPERELDRSRIDLGDVGGDAASPAAEIELALDAALHPRLLRAARGALHARAYAFEHLLDRQAHLVHLVQELAGVEAVAVDAVRGGAPGARGEGDERARGR